jgi:3-phenylpropionate/trans-cinnamate dioxygenase ferredoxin reductase subunit
MTVLGTVGIIGAGLAGTKAAEALRKEGFDGRIELFGDERRLPYLRPPLSKEYLRGESELTKGLVKTEAWYDEQRIELRTGTPVAAIDPAHLEVVLDQGRRVRFDRLLLAPGATPRRFDGPGRDLDGIHYLRTLDDADAIRAAAAEARRALVIGGGWIGSEVAASLRQLGLPVALIATGAVPLEQALGSEVGSIYRDLHVGHGVEIIPNQRVVAFHGRTSVESVETADGARVEGDLVVVGIGSRPRTELAEVAGLDVGNGILVDEHLESSAPRIYVAGDAAAAWHPLFATRLRIEHWDNARRQGRTAAVNMLGGNEPYDRIPYLYSDQYELGMEYSGHAPAWDRVVFRGDPASRAFIAFWLLDGRVVAGMNANIWDVNDAIAALVAARQPVDVDRLVDPTVPLEDVRAFLAPPVPSAI